MWKRFRNNEQPSPTEQVPEELRVMDALMQDTLNVIQSSGVYPSTLILTPPEEPMYTSHQVFKTGIWPHEIYQGDKQILYGINTLDEKNPDEKPLISIDPENAIISLAPTLYGARPKTEKIRKFCKENIGYAVQYKDQLPQIYAKITDEIISPYDWIIDLSKSEIFVIYKNKMGSLFSYTKFATSYIDAQKQSRLKFVREVEEIYLGEDGFLPLGFSTTFIPHLVPALYELGNQYLTTYMMSPSKTDEKQVRVKSKQKWPFNIRSMLPAPV